MSQFQILFFEFNNVQKMKIQERSSIIRSPGDRVNFVKGYLDSVNYFKKMGNDQASPPLDEQSLDGPKPQKSTSLSSSMLSSSKLNDNYTMSEFLKELENILPGIEKEQIKDIRNGNIGNFLG